MSPLNSPADTRSMLDPRLVRQMIVTTLVGLVMFLSASLAGAGTLAPATDAGGSGSRSLTVADMLRGDLSPIAVTDDVAVTEVQAPAIVADILRGEYSPVDAALEIAVTESASAESVAEQLRGDLSPIAQGLV